MTARLRVATFLRFGPLGRAAASEAHGLRWWDDLRADLRVAGRSIRRAPGFHLIFVLTIALGVSLATVIFTAADAILLRSVPYVDRNRTVAVWAQANDGRVHAGMTVTAWQAWRAVGGPFEALAAYDQRGTDYAGEQEAVTIAEAAVSPEFFRVLGVPPVVGRVFSDRDFAERNTAVVSHAFWRRRLGGDAGVIGRGITLDGRTVTVIGVLPPDFGFPRRAIEVWRPLETEGSNVYSVYVIGRLKGTREDAARDLGGLAAALRRDHPEAETEPLILRPFGTRQNAADINEGLAVLLAMAAAVLAIAGLNGANLLLFRGQVRRREFATRLALGAGRGRLVRQLATEAMVSSLLAAAVALGAAVVGVDLLRRAIPSGFTWWSYHDIALDFRIVGLATMGTLGIGLFLSIWPALAAARGSARAFQTGGLAASSRLSERDRGKRGLVGAELALATAMLVGSGLLLRSYWNLNHVDLGLDPDRVVSVAVSLSKARYADRAALSVFGNRLREGIRALPGVADFSVTDGAPPQTAIGFPDSLTAEGILPTYQAIGEIDQITVDTSYFAVVGTPIVAGRRFTVADYQPNANSVIIDPDLAGRLWPGANPVGRRFRLAPSTPWLTVVGVAKSARLGGADDRSTSFELYYAGDPAVVGRAIFLAIRTPGDPARLVEPIRALIHRLNPLLPIWILEPMRAGFDEALAKPRFLTKLVTWFAVVGLVLGLIGLYGVISLSVAQRTAEFGLRVALGASGGAIVRMVVRGALSPVLAGVAAGLLAGLGIGRLAAPLLYQIGPADPATFVAVPLVLIAASTISAAIPARRGARAAPMESLRTD